jgi:hypothetical protein
LKTQREEEHLKAKLILKDNTWEKLLDSIERHSYLDGQIGFILDYVKDNSDHYDQQLFYFGFP